MKTMFGKLIGKKASFAFLMFAIVCAFVAVSTVLYLNSVNEDIEMADATPNVSLAPDDFIVDDVYESKAAFDAKRSLGKYVVGITEGGASKIKNSAFDGTVAFPAMVGDAPIVGVSNNVFADLGESTKNVVKRVVLPNGMVHVDRGFAKKTFTVEGQNKSYYELKPVSGSADKGLFDGMSGLTEVDLPQDMTTIPPRMFQGTSKLASIAFPATLTTVGKAAFVESGLETVSFPKSIKVIDDYAFDLAKLQTIGFENGTGPVTIGAAAFQFNRLTIHQYTDNGPPIAGTEIIVPDGSTIASDAFINQVPAGGDLGGSNPYKTDLTNVMSRSLPTLVKTVSGKAIAETVATNTTTQQWGIDPVSFSRESIYTYSYGGQKTLPEFITEYVYASQEDFLANRPAGMYVTGIADALKQKIAGSGFDGALAFPRTGYDGTPVIGIANGVLDSLSAEEKDKVTSVTMPDTVVDMDHSATPATVQDGGSTRSFKLLSDTDWSTAKGIFQDFGKMTQVHLPAFMTTIPPRMFQGTSELASITLPSSLTAVGKAAFVGSGLETVSFPKSIKVIDDYAFDLAKLQTIGFENGTGPVTIGAAAFQFNRLTIHQYTDNGPPIAGTEIIVPDGSTIAPDAFVNQVPAGGDLGGANPYRTDLTNVVRKSLPTLIKTASGKAIAETVATNTTTQQWDIDPVSFSRELIYVYSYGGQMTPSEFTTQYVYASQEDFLANRPAGMYVTGVTDILKKRIADSGFDGTLAIPRAGYDGTPVIGIANGAFDSLTAEEKDKVTSVNIPDTVVDMDHSVVPTSAQVDGKTVTYGLLSDTDWSTAKGIFQDFGKMTQVHLPAFMTTIPPRMFQGTSKLASIAFPATLTTVGKAAFVGSGLETVSFPKSINTIGDYAFDLAKLQTIGFENGTGPVTIGAAAFQFNKLTAHQYEDNGSLPVADKAIVVPDGSTIASDAFINQLTADGDLGGANPYVTDVTNTVKNAQITLIKTASGKDIPTVIATNTTTQQQGFDPVSFNQGTVYAYSYGGQKTPLGFITQYVYASQEDFLANRPAGMYVTGITDALKKRIADSGFDGTLAFPSTGYDGTPVIGIANGVLDSLTYSEKNKITSVTIPDTVVDMNHSVVSTSAQVDGKTVTYGLLSDTDWSTAKGIFQDFGKMTQAHLPASLTVIPPHLFDHAGLTSIDIPSGVTSIGEAAFLWNNLTSITLPEGLREIGKRAFIYNNLGSVTIPASVDKIDDYAFMATGLTNVTFQGVDGPLAIGKSAFQFNSLEFDENQAPIVITVPANTSIASDAFYNQAASPSKLEKYFKPSDGLKSQGTSPFGEPNLTDDGTVRAASPLHPDEPRHAVILQDAKGGFIQASFAPEVTSYTQAYNPFNGKTQEGYLYSYGGYKTQSVKVTFKYVTTGNYFAQPRTVVVYQAPHSSKEYDLLQTLRGTDLTCDDSTVVFSSDKKKMTVPVESEDKTITINLKDPYPSTWSGTGYLDTRAPLTIKIKDPADGEFKSSITLPPREETTVEATMSIVGQEVVKEPTFIVHLGIDTSSKPNNDFDVKADSIAVEETRQSDGSPLTESQIKSIEFDKTTGRLVVKLKDVSDYALKLSIPGEFKVSDTPYGGRVLVNSFLLDEAQVVINGIDSWTQHAIDYGVSTVDIQKSYWYAEPGSAVPGTVADLKGKEETRGLNLGERAVFKISLGYMADDVNPVFDKFRVVEVLPNNLGLEAVRHPDGTLWEPGVQNDKGVSYEVLYDYFGYGRVAVSFSADAPFEINGPRKGTYDVALISTIAQDGEDRDYYSDYSDPTGQKKLHQQTNDAFAAVKGFVAAHPIYGQSSGLTRVRLSSNEFATSFVRVPVKVNVDVNVRQYTKKGALGEYTDDKPIVDRPMQSFLSKPVPVGVYAAPGKVYTNELHIELTPEDPGVKSLDIVDILPAAHDIYLMRDGSGAQVSRGSEFSPRLAGHLASWAIPDPPFGEKTFDYFYTTSDILGALKSATGATSEEILNQAINSATWFGDDQLTEENMSRVTAVRIKLREGRSLQKGHGYVQEVKFYVPLRMPETNESVERGGSSGSQTFGELMASKGKNNPAKAVDTYVANLDGAGWKESTKFEFRMVESLRYDLAYTAIGVFGDMGIPDGEVIEGEVLEIQELINQNLPADQIDGENDSQWKPVAGYTPQTTDLFGMVKWQGLDPNKYYRVKQIKASPISAPRESVIIAPKHSFYNYQDPGSSYVGYRDRFRFAWVDANPTGEPGAFMLSITSRSQIPSIYMGIMKVDQDNPGTEQYLQGASFRIDRLKEGFTGTPDLNDDSQWVEYGTITTGKDYSHTPTSVAPYPNEVRYSNDASHPDPRDTGFASAYLRYGDYRIVEVQAPTGYKSSGGKWLITKEDVFYHWGNQVKQALREPVNTVTGNVSHYTTPEGEDDGMGWRAYNEAGPFRVKVFKVTNDQVFDLKIHKKYETNLDKFASGADSKPLQINGVEFSLMKPKDPSNPSPSPLELDQWEPVDTTHGAQVQVTNDKNKGELVWSDLAYPPTHDYLLVEKKAPIGVAKIEPQLITKEMIQSQVAEVPTGEKGPDGTPIMRRVLDLNEGFTMNYPTPRASVGFNKVDEHGEALAGAVFEIQSSNGVAEARGEQPDPGNDAHWGGVLPPDVVTRVTSEGPNGAVVFRHLPIANYRIIEVHAPDGYNKLVEPILVTKEQLEYAPIQDPNIEPLVQLPSVVNTPTPKLPHTGGLGQPIHYFAGTLCALVSLSFWRRQRTVRKEMRGEN